MNFAESVQYLYRLGNEMAAMKLGLESIRRLAGAMGEPQLRVSAVHIAGTNGKGSTSAMTASILGAAGLRVGLYTSPHLVSVTERIRMDGTAITEEEFASLATRVREVGERLVADGTLPAPPTFFEQATMIAYLAFAEGGAEVAVLEVGLGGRLDATNICRPLATAITPVDLDHQQYLGDTLAAIAGEKAGILKPGVPAVVAPQAPEAMAVIEARAREVGAPLVSVAERFAGAQVEAVAEGRYRLRGGGYDVLVPLRGRYQATNAMTAISLAEQLRAAGLPVSREAILDGIARAEWPGRLELLSVGEPARRVLLDGAHNAAGAAVLAEFLRAHFTDRPVTMIFAAMADKEIGAMARALFPLADRLILTRVDSPRAADPKTLAGQAGARADAPLCIDRAAEALAEAIRRTPPEGLICACGSLFLVGELKQAMAVRS